MRRLLALTLATLFTASLACAQTVVPSYQEQASGNVKAGIGVTVLSGGGGGGDASAANQTAIQANAGSDATKANAVQGITGGKAIPVSGTFWQATQPVSGTVATTGTYWQATQPVSGTVTASNTAGNVASAGADSGNPVKVGCVYNTTPPAVTNGQRVDCQANPGGAQRYYNQQTARPSSNFTFSASTPLYAAGHLVANSATAGSVTPFSWTITTTAACSADVYSASLSITQTGTGLNTGMDGWQLLLHLTTSAPTFGAGDGVAYRITTGGANEVAVFACTLTQYDDAATGMCIPQTGALPLKLASGSTLSGYLVAQGAPVGGARQASKVVTATLYEKMDFC